MVRAPVLASLIIVAMPTLAAAEPLTQCVYGQPVIDTHRNVGQIVGEHSGSCLVRSPDGRLQSWVAPNELSPFQPPRMAAMPPLLRQPGDVGEGSEPPAGGPVVTSGPEYYGWPPVFIAPGQEDVKRRRFSHRRSFERKPVPMAQRQASGRSWAGFHPNFAPSSFRH